MKLIKGRKEGGFTLIELIVVIVILGILSVVAVPKFISLTTDAEKGVARSVTAALRGAITVLHSQFLLKGTTYDYDAASVVDQIDTADVTLTTTAGGIIATFPSGGTYTWTYTDNTGTGGTVPAQVTEAF